MHSLGEIQGVGKEKRGPFPPTLAVPASVERPVRRVVLRRCQMTSMISASRPTEDAYNGYRKMQGAVPSQSELADHSLSADLLQAKFSGLIRFV